MHSGVSSTQRQVVPAYRLRRERRREYRTAPVPAVYPVVLIQSQYCRSCISAVGTFERRRNIFGIANAPSRAASARLKPATRSASGDSALPSTHQQRRAGLSPRSSGLYGAWISVSISSPVTASRSPKRKAASISAAVFHEPSLGAVYPGRLSGLNNILGAVSPLPKICGQGRFGSALRETPVLSIEDAPAHGERISHSYPPAD